MMNVRVISTLAGACMVLSLLVGFSLMRILARRRPLVGDAPPYAALHV